MESLNKKLVQILTGTLHARYFEEEIENLIAQNMIYGNAIWQLDKKYQASYRVWHYPMGIL